MPVSRRSISVVIPVYQRQELLNRALASVLQQDADIDAIIIVDDGSTPAIVPLYDDPCITLVRVSHSGMPGKVRNIGLKHVSSNWLAFLDSDDIWLPEKLKFQRAALEKQRDAIAVFTQEYWMRRGILRSSPKPIHQEKALFQASLQKCVMGPSTMLVRSDVLHTLGGFREDLVFGEDYECWIRLLLQGRVGALDQALTIKYACLGDNLSEITPMQEGYRLRAIWGIVQQLQNGELDAAPWQWALIRSALCKKFDIVYAGALKHNNPSMLTWLAEIKLTLDAF